MVRGGNAACGWIKRKMRFALYLIRVGVKRPIHVIPDKTELALKKTLA
jgi:hypothetical protein